MEKNLKTISFKGLKWINMVSPTAEHIRFLENTFGFHELDLEDLTERKIQRSKIDDYENYLFIVLHLPFYHKGKDRLISTQLDIFVGPDYFITIHSGAVKTLEAMFEKCTESRKTRQDFMESGSGYLLYEVLSGLFDYCFPLMDELEDEITDMERQLFRHSGRQRDMLKDILMMKKDLITLNRIILPQRTVIAQLEHKHKKFIPEDLDVYFDDVVDKIEKLWHSVEHLRDLIESLKDINESVISHDTNKIIKTLTVFSVIIMPLTLLSGIYGMNLANLPIAEREDSFFVLLGIMVIIALVMLVYFRHKKWI